MLEINRIYSHGYRLQVTSDRFFSPCALLLTPGF